MTQLTMPPLGNIHLDQQDGGVWIATLNRPDKRNALDAASVEDLVTLFSNAPRAGARAIVLAGAGDHFCAGLDLVEHHGAAHVRVSNAPTVKRENEHSI